MPVLRCGSSSRRRPGACACSGRVAPHHRVPRVRRRASHSAAHGGLPCRYTRRCLVARARRRLYHGSGPAPHCSRSSVHLPGCLRRYHPSWYAVAAGPSCGVVRVPHRPTSRQSARPTAWSFRRRCSHHPCVRPAGSRCGAAVLSARPSGTRAASVVVGYVLLGWRVPGVPGCPGLVAIAGSY